MGFKGKDRDISPERALPTVWEGRVSGKWVPLLSRLTAKISQFNPSIITYLQEPSYGRRAIGTSLSHGINKYFKN